MSTARARTSRPAAMRRRATPAGTGVPDSRADVARPRPTVSRTVPASSTTAMDRRRASMTPSTVRAAAMMAEGGAGREGGGGADCRAEDQPLGQAEGPPATGRAHHEQPDHEQAGREEQ